MLEFVLALVGLSCLGFALTWVFPTLLRPVLWLAAHGLYRLRTYNADRIPRTGGVLVVANHASFVDWLVLWLACPRPATFVLWAGYYRYAILRFILSWGRHHTIRIDDRTDRPRGVMGGLAQISEALSAGRLVVMFPEGALTRSGTMLPFARGVEWLLQTGLTGVGVVPTAIQGLWGGFFSYAHGRPLRKLPRAWRPRVAVWFGQLGTLECGVRSAELVSAECGVRSAEQSSTPHSALPTPHSELRTPNCLTAPNLRLAVQECIADLAIRESDHIPLVHRAFLTNATRLRTAFRPCVVDSSSGSPQTFSWLKALIAVMCVTRYLRSRLGDRPNVGIWLPTSLGGMLANLAITFLGRTSVNLNYTAGAAPVRSALRQAGIRVVVTARRFTARAPLELPEGVEAIYLEDVMASITRWQRVRTLLLVLAIPGWAIDRFVLKLHRHRIDDPLTIVFSSGSTGEPKGVVLTHRNVGHNVDAAIRTIGIVPHDRLFAVLPFFHSFGYTVCLWAPLVAGCSAVFYPDPRQAKEVGDLARTLRTTILLGTATFLRFYIRRCEPDAFRTLRVLVCGAEKLPVKLQEEFQEKFGLRPLEGYGCTELSPVVSTNLPDLLVDGFVQERNRPGTVGQPIFGVCVRSFRIEAPERVPLLVGQEGVLCVKGPNVMSGYLHQPERTAEAVKDGWYNTGDCGLIEPDGFIRITGRVSRFAKIAGEMVPLERLDEELHEVLGVCERVLAVAAIPDEKRGERLVVLHLAEVEDRMREVLEALGRRGLPNLWVPDPRDCHRVEAMPVLGSGKLDLKKLGDLALELGGRG